MPTIIKVGGGYKNLKGTATTADVLSNKTFSTNGKELVTGSMTNNGSVTQSLNCGSSYTIPKGYHDGSGKVTANSLSSQTSGTATASDILSGKTAWVNGAKITGNIASLGATTYTPTTSNQTIASGKYLSGAQTIKGDANLVASNIAYGKSIFGITGTYEGGEFEDRIITIPSNYRDLAEYPHFSVNGSNNNRALFVTSTRKIKGVEYIVKRSDNNNIYMYILSSPVATTSTKGLADKRLATTNNYYTTSLDEFMTSTGYRNDYNTTCVVYKDNTTVELNIYSQYAVQLTVYVRLYY